MKCSIDMENTALRRELILTPGGVEKFLSSRWVEGIGPAYAQRIVDRFGTEAIRTLRDEPEKVAEIPGIGINRATSASESIRNAAPHDVNTVAFLYSCGIGDLFIERILAKYRKRAHDVVLNDPYSMVEDVWQLSFFTADKIGRYLNIEADDPRRLEAALVTAVKHFAEDGHLFASVDEAVGYASSITSVSPEKIRQEVDRVVQSGRNLKSMVIFFVALQ